MKRFTALYQALDQAKGTTAKLEALVAYFSTAPAADAAWAVQLLAGNRIRQPVTSTQLFETAAEHAGLPVWLVGECQDAVGDLGETIALLLEDPEEGSGLSLSELIESHTLPLRMMSAPQRAVAVRAMWRRLGREQSLVWHKIMLGDFRVGVARRNLVRALAMVAGVEPAAMGLALSGSWRPTAEHYTEVMRGGSPAASVRPYPFFLAHPLEREPESLGDVAQWLLEWKYDGIRAQLIRRGGATVLWSRGEEPIGGAFPEIAALGRLLPEGTALDGEILAWHEERPLPFASLQRRLGRSRVDLAFWDEVPVVFMAFDLLEEGGADLRSAALEARRARLEALVSALAGERVLRLSPRIEVGDWGEAARRRGESRERGVEGIVIKRRRSSYGTGRTGGDWWKWKIDPYTIDAVLVAAQPGQGRRAGLHTDYTFAVWSEERLVVVTKAYSGLTDDEFRAVDRFVHENTVSRHGPLRRVKPELVFEIGFEGIQESRRHHSGVALRFPRMLRWRRDKAPSDADHLDALRRIITQRRGPPQSENPECPLF